MSMLTAQCDELRTLADELRKIKEHNTDWLHMEALTLFRAMELLREAADTIEALRDRLQDAMLGSGECEYKPMWNDDDPLAEEYCGMWHTGCGEALTWNAENDGCGAPPAFCPYCGGKVTITTRCSN